MSDMQRYDLGTVYDDDVEGDVLAIVENATGDYVLYEDAAAEIATLRTTVASQREAMQGAREAMVGIEWVEFGASGETYCPCCQSMRRLGHRGGCSLRAALAALDAALGTGEEP